MPAGWTLAVGLVGVDPGTPMPLFAYRILLRIQVEGSAYVENDGSMEVLEAMGVLLDVCEKLDYLCLQETAFVFQPAVVGNLEAGTGFLIVNKRTVTVKYGEAEKYG